MPLIFAIQFAKPVMRPAKDGATKIKLGQYAPEKARSVKNPMTIIKIKTKYRKWHVEKIIPNKQAIVDTLPLELM